jgi:hypothetical protein
MGQDLRGTPIAAVMDQYFDRLAQGNEGNADIERLERDGTVIRYKVKIQHKHVIKISTPFGKKKVTVYSVTSDVEGEFDALNPSGAQAELCVNTPVGEQCFDLRELIEIVGAML